MQIRCIFCAASILFAGAIVQAAGPVGTGFTTIIDGRVGPQYAKPGDRNVQLYFKPQNASQSNLLVENVLIHDVTNQKGIDIVANRQPDGTAWAYRNITVRNYEAYNIYRTIPGLHIDFLRIAGGGSLIQNNVTDVHLENIFLHDGDALPLIVQDGQFGTVTLRNVRFENTQHGQVHISTQNSGSIERIIIEDSPGLRVAVMNRPGTIGELEIINSPGALFNGYPRMDVPLTIRNTPAGSVPTPEPGLLGILAPGALLLLRRRR